MLYVYGFEVIYYDVCFLLAGTFMNMGSTKWLSIRSCLSVVFLCLALHIIGVLMFWEGDLCVHIVGVNVHGGNSL